MKVSREGIDLITRWEGCKLKAYKDGGGVLTIGYGHTSVAGPPQVTPGLTITAQEAKDIFVRDLVQYEAGVMRALRRAPLQPQFDAMVSLCYNIGDGAFSKSSVVRAFNEGDLNRAANAFLLWVKDNGKRIKGLENRRAAEREHFRKATKQHLVEATLPVPTASTFTTEFPGTPKPVPAIPQPAPKENAPQPTTGGFWGWLMDRMF